MERRDVMTEPLVSIGMPCYNRLEQLRTAIESIRNQSYQNLEIIISNDASPNPEIYTMLDDYAAKDSRIRLFHQPHDLGCYGNYYFVLQQATGKYFMYAQDDDTWEPECIELLVKELEVNPESAVAISAVRYVCAGKVYSTYRLKNENLLSLITGEKIAFFWMGVWRTDKLRLFDRDGDDIHGKDIIISSEAVLSLPYVYVDKILYNKTLYHNKARQYVEDNPMCLLQMYKHFILRTTQSPHIPFNNKLKLIGIIPAFGLRVVMMYLVQPFYYLGFYNRLRSKSREEYNKVYADD
jgi:glycosyltransferase involved in cell wall biosynthesis